MLLHRWAPVTSSPIAARCRVLMRQRARATIHSTTRVIVPSRAMAARAPTMRSGNSAARVPHRAHHATWQQAPVTHVLEGAITSRDATPQAAVRHTAATATATAPVTTAHLGATTCLTVPSRHATQCLTAHVTQAAWARTVMPRARPDAARSVASPRAAIRSILATSLVMGTHFTHLHRRPRRNHHQAHPHRPPRLGCHRFRLFHPHRPPLHRRGRPRVQIAANACARVRRRRQTRVVTISCQLARAQVSGVAPSAPGSPQAIAGRAAPVPIFSRMSI